MDEFGNRLTVFERWVREIHEAYPGCSYSGLLELARRVGCPRSDVVTYWAKRRELNGKGTSRVQGSAGEDRVEGGGLQWPGWSHSGFGSEERLSRSEEVEPAFEEG